MAATYAGYGLIRPTPELMLKIQRWWDAAAPELWGHPGYLTRGLDHLPIPYPPPRQRAPFNTLVWPVGASRWGVFHGLVDGGTLANLEATAISSPCPVAYSLTIAGFGAPDNNYNGSWSLTSANQTVWTVTSGAVTITATSAGGGNWTLALANGTSTPQYTVTGVSDCCGSITFSLSAGGGSTTPPATLPMSPASPCGNSSVAASLTISDGTNPANTITAQMFLINARPVFQLGAAPNSGNLYWITLVDARYFWWNRQETFTFAAGDSWSTLLTNLVSAGTGLTPTVPTIPSAYGSPSPIRWGIPNVPLPLLIDAAAAQIGLRFLYDPGGTARFVLPADAATADTNQYAAYKTAVSYGGRRVAADVVGDIPANIAVAFWGDTATVMTKSLKSLAPAAYGGLTGVTNAHAWLMADQRAGAASPTPSSLVTQMATDYYTWALALTDCTFVGIQPVVLTGMEDRIEWQHCPGIENAVRESSNSPLLDHDMPWNRVLTRIVPVDLHDRNINGDRAPPGFTYLVKLTTQSAPDSPKWKATIQVWDSGSDALTDGPALGFGADDYFLFVPPNIPVAPNILGTAIPDPLVPATWSFSPIGIDVEIILITSGARNADGDYPGVIQYYDPNTGTWSNGETVWIRDAN